MRINAFGQKCLRKILKIFWHEHISNHEIYNISGRRPKTDIVQEKRLKLYNIVSDKESGNLKKQVMDWNMTSKRCVGRPRITWNNNINKDIGCSMSDKNLSIPSPPIIEQAPTITPQLKNILIQIPSPRPNRTKRPSKMYFDEIWQHDSPDKLIRIRPKRVRIANPRFISNV